MSIFGNLHLILIQGKRKGKPKPSRLIKDECQAWLLPNEFSRIHSIHELHQKDPSTLFQHIPELELLAAQKRIIDKFKTIERTDENIVERCILASFFVGTT